MMSKTEDFDVLRIETVFELKALCTMNDGVSRTIGALNAEFGFGHSPPS
jgi:hypothetical protein